MLTTFKHYKRLFSGTLARCFPRTTDYLRTERTAALFHPRPGMGGRAAAGTDNAHRAR